MNPQRIRRRTDTRPVTAGLFAVTAGTVMLATCQLLAGTLYVSQTSPNPSPPYSTWDTATHEIQIAVDAAGEGDTVLVAAGNYALTHQVSIAKGILLRSDAGPNQTSLDGQFLTRCLWISNSLAVVAGFTMTRGYETDGSDLAGGVVMFGGTLTHCVVQKPGNPFGVGRLVYCRGGGLITDCYIGPNYAFENKGGGVYLADSELRNSTISRMLYGPAYGGADEGAGIYAISSTISGCVITRSFARRAGGGVYLNGCLMDRCIIGGNSAGVFLITAGRGGGVFATNSVIRNSLIATNAADAGYDPVTGIDGGLPSFGGGAFLDGSILLNCTVTENKAVPSSGTEPSKGGGVYVSGSGNSIIRNSIVYFNSASSGANWYWDDSLFPIYQQLPAGEAPFTYSCTAPDPGGVGLGNIVTAPQFADQANGNYHLGPASPCRCSGSIEDWMSGACDLDGNPRTVSGTVDMGAYENQSPPTPQELVVAIIGMVNDLTQQGALGRNDGKPLLAKLNAALAKLNQNRPAVACNQLRAFKHQVQANVKRGTLTTAQGESLIFLVDEVLRALGCR